MTKRFMFLLALLALLSFTFVACDDDNDSKTDNEPTVDADSTPDPDVVPDTDTPISDLCKDVDCSGKGTCEVVQNSAGEDVAECACNDGFAWAGRNHEVCVCYNDESKVAPETTWESYIGYNIAGVIASNDDQNPSFTVPTKAIGKLKNYPEKTFGGDGYLNGLIIKTTLNYTDGSTADGIIYLMLADPDMETQRYTTYVQTVMRTELLQAIIAPIEDGGLAGTADFAPQTSVYEMKANHMPEDNIKSSRECIRAVNVFAANQTAGGDAPVGFQKICADDAATFAIGEQLNLLTSMQLTDKAEDIVAMYSDINSVNDLCTCTETEDTNQAGAVTAIYDHNGDGDAYDTIDCTTGAVIENCPDATGKNCVEVTPPTDNDPVVDEDVVVPVDEDVVVPVDEDVVVPVDEEPVVDADPVE